MKKYISPFCLLAILMMIAVPFSVSAKTYNPSVKFTFKNFPKGTTFYKCTGNTPSGEATKITCQYPTASVQVPVCSDHNRWHLCNFSALVVLQYTDSQGQTSFPSASGLVQCSAGKCSDISGTVDSPHQISKNQGSSKEHTAYTVTYVGK